MQRENIKLYMTIHIHNRSKINEQIDGRNVKEKKKKVSSAQHSYYYLHPLYFLLSKKKNQRRSDEEKAKKEKLPNIIFTNHFEDC